MSKLAVEQYCNGTVAIGTSYDHTRFTGGSLIKQWNLGSSTIDKFMGPPPPQPIRTASIMSNSPSLIDVIKWDTNIYWIFNCSTTVGTAVYRTLLSKYDASTNTATPIGYIQASNPSGAGTSTPRGIKVIYGKYTTGTVEVSGTAVTGTSTTWNTDRMCVGYRIGFGSTNPASIVTWYEISAIGSDTSITLTATAGTISAGSAYVIEELMIVTAVVSGTATNSGVHVIKGLRYETFITTGTAVAAATTTDRIRACYWLKDASTVTTVAPMGICMEAFSSYTTQYVYMMNGSTTNCKMFKMNVRAALTPTSGAQVLTGGDLVVTGAQVVSNTFATYGECLELATTSHGPGSGVACLYFTNGTRVYRALVSSIVNTSTTWIADNMPETPPGGTGTHPNVAAMAAIKYMASIDRFFISTNSTTCKTYITQYQTIGGQFDSIIFESGTQLDSSASVAPAPHPKCNANGGLTASDYDGYLFLANSSTNGTTEGHVTTIATEWAYAAVTGQRLIFPYIPFGSTPSKFYRVATNHVNYIGATSPFGRTVEPHRIYYRTSGITDDSGSWTTIDESGDLSSASTASSIQFMIEFKTLSEGSCIPARILGLTVVYESATALPSQYMWNFADSSSTTGTFAFIQASLFGSGPGVHTINIYRSDTNALVLTQDSGGTTNGTFEYWNGSAWTAGLSTDTVGMRRRFVPSAGLPSGIDLYATLTVV